MMQAKKLANLFLLLLSFTFSIAAQATEIYQLEPNHSYIIWKVNHLGFSSVTGKFMASGIVMIDEKAPAKSSVDVTIQTGIMDTDVGKLNEVLTGKDYFDTANYQTATFKSTSVKLTKKSTGKVTGLLTIRGISKPVTLTVVLNQHAEHPIFQRDAYGFTATASIKRSDFNMRGFLPGVSDEVKLWIQAEAVHNR